MILQTGKNRSADPRWPDAFTLVELMLVMALLTIVIAVSAPSLSHFFRGRVLDSEARRLVSLTRYGQSRAVSEGVPMVLWMDTKQGTYGLRQETGSNEADKMSVEYVLGRDLHLSVADLPAAFGQLNRTRMTRQADPNIPTLRFQPDGFIDESSPQSVELRENSSESNVGESIWITQSRNRLNYEIHTNASPNISR